MWLFGTQIYKNILRLDKPESLFPENQHLCKLKLDVNELYVPDLWI